MVAFVRLSTGKLCGLDDFSTGGFATLSNNWDTAGAQGTVAIETGELSSSGTNQTVGIESLGQHACGVACWSAKRVSGLECNTFWRVSGAPASLSGYGIMVNNAGSLKVQRRDAGASTNLTTKTLSLGTTLHAFKVVHDTSGNITLYVDGVSQLSAVDSTYLTGRFRCEGWGTSTIHVHHDNVALCSSNLITCSGLPTGWKLRCGGKAAVEVGGTATLDLVELTLPQGLIEVLNGADVVQESLTLTNDVWGGDTYRYGNLTAVGRDFESRFHLRNLVGRDFESRFNVKDTDPVGRDFESRFHLRNLAGRDFESRFNVSGSVGRDFESRFGVWPFLYFTENPTWEPDLGTKVNRVWCLVENSTPLILVSAQIPGLAEQDVIEICRRLPAGTSEAEALTIAAQILALYTERPPRIEGETRLSCRVSFDRKANADWYEARWDPVTKTYVRELKRSVAGLLVKKIEILIDNGKFRTRASLGDYVKPAEDLVTELIGKLQRKQ